MQANGQGKSHGQMAGESEQEGRTVIVATSEVLGPGNSPSGYAEAGPDLRGRCG